MNDFVHGDAAFHFSFRTIVGFAMGFIIGWALWLFLRRRIIKSADRN